MEFSVCYVTAASIRCRPVEPCGIVPRSSEICSAPVPSVARTAIVYWPDAGGTNGNSRDSMKSSLQDPRSSLPASSFPCRNSIPPFESRGHLQMQCRADRPMCRSEAPAQTCRPEPQLRRTLCVVDSASLPKNGPPGTGPYRYFARYLASFGNNISGNLVFYLMVLFQ
jgi:hypothetical protein